MKPCLVILITFIFGSGFAQGTFQNLNFELADPGSGTYALNVPVANALPYWTVTIGGVQQTEINYNDISTGSTEVTLVSAANTVFPAIDGNYSMLLTGGLTASAASISQTGLIPTGSQSLLFEAQPGLGPLDILVGGQNIPFTAIGAGANYTLYGANISAWGGDSEPITFAALKDSSAFSNWLIDDISFSTQAVPEANPLVLTGVGGLLFALYRRFAPKRP